MVYYLDHTGEAILTYGCNPSNERYILHFVDGWIVDIKICTKADG
jgi:hypothetical protein